MINLYEVLHKIGFDWQVALANLVNFLIILFLLKKFAFKPVGKMIKDRQDKIAEGIAKANEAAARLHEVDVMAKGMLKEADQKAIAAMEVARLKAGELEASLAKKAQDHYDFMVKEAEDEHSKRSQQSQQQILKEAGELVKEIIIKTVALDPKAIDDALIERAVSQIKKEL